MSQHDPAAPDRRTLVERARVQWITRLTDYSRDNNLLYHRPLLPGSWEVPAPHEFSLHQLIAGVRTPVAKLSPTARLLDDSDDLAVIVAPESLGDDAVGAVRRLEYIRRRADENFEETGIDTMHLVYGLATWPASDGGSPTAAPVLLVPVTIEASLERMAIQRCADPELNLELLHLLAGWGCPGIDPAMIDELTTANTSDVGPILDRIVAAVDASAARVVQGFAIDRRVVIGNFSHERIRVVDDLLANGARLAANPIIAALAGDAGARAELAYAQTAVDPAGLDAGSPADEFGIVDGDGAQRAVVAHALAGRSVVVTGGPGTGKTQTIANIVAELVAAGRKVLVAIGKSAGIDAVQAHFTAAGVDELILDLHDVVTRREFMEQFADALEAVRVAPPVAQTSGLDELGRRREILVAHAERMNRPQPPTELSLFAMLGEMLRISEATRSDVRFHGEALARLHAKAAAEIEELLTAEATVDDLLFATNPSPWTPARLFSEADARRAHAAAVTLDRAWAQFKQSLEGVLGETRLRWPKDLVETRALADMVELAGRLQRVYAPGVWSLNLDDVLKGVRLGLGQGLAKAVTRVTYGQYKRSHRELVAVRTGPDAGAAGDPEEIPAESLHPEALDLIKLREVWRVDGEAGVTPRGAAWLPNLQAVLRAFEAELPDLEKAFPTNDLRAYPLQALPDLLHRLASDPQTVMRVPTHCTSTDRLRALGMAPLLDVIVAERRPKEVWIGTFRAARVLSAFDGAWAADPGLPMFDGVSHDQLVNQFARLDRERVSIAAARLRRLYAVNAVTAMNQYPEQTALVRQETAKREGIMDPGRLSGAASEVMTALKPCWMVSPLEAANQIDGSREHFDVVVLDDANLMLVEEAIPALARARSCIVFGDCRQLPRRPLVAWRNDAEGDGAEPPAGAQDVMSVLSAAAAPIVLRTDYRSADERLVALSNSAVYGGEMHTTPAPEKALPIRLAVVTPDDGETAEGTSAAEVRRVVELVAEHARSDPERSLGIVTLGDRHARRIEAALTVARRSDDELARFCTRGKEPVFVKDVARVQGDQRDHCILSIGYRVGSGGFGALSREGGERRFNVAMTRGRRRVTVVTSFAAADLPAGGAAGVELLRRYLDLATTGNTEGLAAAPPERRAAIEEDVEAALRARGVPVTPRLGLSGLRVDLAVGHPEKPGVHVLAVEVDGPSYWAMPTARDRDRLRHEHLERLGWSHTRLWALEWYLRRDAAVTRILEDWRSATQRYDLRASGHLAATAPAAAPIAAVTAVPQRTPRPPVPPGRQITAYSQQEIWLMATWVLSDGLLRTDDEIVDEVARELAFPYVDPITDRAIRAVVRPPG